MVTRAASEARHPRSGLHRQAEIGVSSSAAADSPHRLTAGCRTPEIASILDQVKRSDPKSRAVSVRIEVWERVDLYGV